MDTENRQTTPDPSKENYGTQHKTLHSSNLEQSYGRRGETPPFWEDMHIQSFKEAVIAVGIEGVERLIYAKSDHQIDLLHRWLGNKGADRRSVITADNFYCHFRSQVAEVAVLLGYALAITQPPLDDFETWLQMAIAKAGLGGYRLPMMLDLEVIDEVYPSKPND